MAAIDYGVCRLAVVPVRREPDHRTEQVTQLLFGDHYGVFGESKDHRWVSIRIHADECAGWVERTQHHPISSEYFEQINLANFKITTDVASSILYKKSQLTIVLGSIVPISGSELFKMEEQFAFNGEAKSLGQRRDMEFMRSIVDKYMNSPHQTGGKSPFGIDGPGFVQMVFRISGFSLMRECSRQMTQGKRVTDLEAAVAGDLAFFRSKDGKVNHVGIIMANQRIVHCHGKVRMDYLMDEGILNQETKIYTHSLAEIRRVMST